MNPVEEGKMNKYFTSDRILELSKQFGLESDYSIAKACGVQQPSVLYWRRNSAMISLRVAVTFCKSVGISYHEYLGEKSKAADDSADSRAWNSLSDRQKMAVRTFRNYVTYLGNMGLEDDALSIFTQNEKMNPQADLTDQSGSLIECMDDPSLKEEPLFISEYEGGGSKRKTLSIRDENGREWTFTAGELAAARELLEFIRSEELSFNKPFIKIAEGMDFYGLGEDQFRALAIEAGAFLKFTKSTIVCRADFERYIKDHYRVRGNVENDSCAGEA